MIQHLLFTYLWCSAPPWSHDFLDHRCISLLIMASVGFGLLITLRTELMSSPLLKVSTFCFVSDSTNWSSRSKPWKSALYTVFFRLLVSIIYFFATLLAHNCFWFGRSIVRYFNCLRLYCPFLRCSIVFLDVSSLHPFSLVLIVHSDAPTAILSSVVGIATLLITKLSDVNQPIILAFWRWFSSTSTTLWCF